MKKAVKFLSIIFIFMILFGCGKKQDTLLAYRDEGDGCVVYTTRHKQMTSVVIPKKANGKKVIGIADNAFDSCSLLHSVKLPETIEKIGAGAFDDCYNLAIINIPSSVTSIGAGAFRYCASLHNFTIPSGMTIINDGTFRGCDGLNTITIPKTITTIGPYAFDECRCLSKVNYDGTDDEWSNITIGQYNEPLLSVKPNNKGSEDLEKYNVSCISSGKGSARIVTSEELHYNSNVSVEAIPDDGYRLYRWTNSSNSTLSTELIYNFVLLEKNTTIIAEFIPNKYTISVSNEEKKTFSTMFEQRRNDLYDCIIPGVKILDVIDNDNSIFLKLSFDRSIGSQVDYRYRAILMDLDWIAKNGISYIDTNPITTWEIHYSTINKKDNEYFLEDSDFILEVDYESNYKFPTPIKNGYTFLGWYYNGNKLTDNNGNSLSAYLFKESIIVTAKWEAKEYNVTFDKDYNDLIVSGSGRYNCGETVSLSATNIPENYSIRWIRSDGVVGFGDIYEFDMSSCKLIVTVETVFKYIIDENTLYFGYYPQTLEKDSTILEKLNNNYEIPSSDNNYWSVYPYYENGELSEYMYYIDVDLDNDGAKDYRGVYFNKYRPKDINDSSTKDNSYQDENGYSKESVYWFKYELIKWTILETNDGYAKLLSTLTIDSQDFHHEISENEFDHNGGNGFANNYELSDIRIWLNNTFYETAFSDYGKSIIELVTINNGSSTTCDINNPYCCNDTLDHVFLLSYEDAKTTYKLGGSRVSDYALCQGTYGWPSSNTPIYYQVGYYLRSPKATDQNYVSGMFATANGSNCFSDTTYIYGIRPAIYIKI